MPGLGQRALILCCHWCNAMSGVLQDATWASRTIEHEVLTVCICHFCACSQISALYIGRAIMACNIDTNSLAQYSHLLNTAIT